jgi:hypothetical protein
MHKLKILWKKYIVEILLVLLIFVAYLPWIIPKGYLAGGDWSFHYTSLLKEFLTIPKIWEAYNNLGGVDVLPSFDPIKVSYGILSHLVLYGISERLLYFWPILIFSYFGVLKLGRYLYDNKFAQLAFAIFYLFNTLILALQTSFITYAVVYALAPLVVYFYLKLLDKPDTGGVILTSILLLICTIYEPRGLIVLTYLLSAVTLIRFIVSGFSIKIFIAFAGIYFLLALLNSDWIIVAFSGAGPGGVVASTQNLFTAYTTLSDALFFHNYAWQGDIFKHFTLTPFHQVGISYYFPIVTLIEFGSLLFIKKMPNETKSKYLITTFLALISIFLFKQQNNPFGFLYQYAFKNIPTFSLFRESNKFTIFMLPVAVAYGISASYLLNLIKQNRLRLIFLLLVVCVPLINLIPLIDREIGTLFVDKEIPESYSLINNLISSTHDEYYRVMWVPNTTTWSIGTETNPSIGAASLPTTQISNLFSSAAISSSQNIVQTFEEPYAHNFINSLDVKYIVVPPRDLPYEDIYTDYGGNRELYINLLNSLPWLKRIKSNSNIAIYENISAVKYIDTSNELNTISADASLVNLFSFTQSQLGQKTFSFRLSSPTNGFKTTSINDIFNDLNPSQFSKGIIKPKLNITKNSQGYLHINTNHPNLKYDVIKNHLTIYLSNPNKITVNGISIGQDLGWKPIFSTPINLEDKYYFDDGRNLISMVQKSDVNLGSANNSYGLFALAGPNLVNDPTFKNGLWEKNVSNCNDYKIPETVSMVLSKNASSGSSKSVLLEASNYTACTGPKPINVKSGEYYKISFNYRVKIANQAGYRLTFNNPRRTVINQNIPASTNWLNFSQLVHIPNGATHLTIQLLGYPDEQLRMLASTYYDNLQLENLALIKSIPIDTAPSYINLPVNSSSSVLYKDANYEYKNMISNAQLKKGLWQKKVGDCDNYDANPKLAMKLDINMPKMGQNSLELDATRHAACTGPPPIKVDENSKVYLSFDYQSPDASNAGYVLSFNDPNHTSISMQLPIIDKNWHTYSTIVTVPNGANHVSLNLYSYEASPAITKDVNRYSDFYVFNVPDVEGSYFLTSQPIERIIKPKSVSYRIINPTKKLVKIVGATTPLYLNMSETYNTGWRLEFNNSKVQGANEWLPNTSPDVIPSTDHYELNDYANGWYINTYKLCRQEKLCKINSDGSYNLNLEIEFTPQRYFDVGMIISVLTLMGCVVYLCRFYYVRSQKLKEKHHVS